MSTSIKHSRPIPDEWPELSALARATIPPDVPIRRVPFARLVRLGNQAGRLTTNRLEVNAYYGLGELMTRLHAHLKEPGIQDELIRKMAMRMVGRAVKQRRRVLPMNKPFTPLLGDLNTDVLEWPIANMATRLQNDAPTDQSTLWDTVVGQTTLRRATKGMRILPRMYASAANAVALRYSRLTAASTGANSLGGTISIYRMLLADRDDPKQKITKKHLQQPLTEEMIGNARLDKAFGFSARLRTDEFREGAGWTIENGRCHFDRTVLDTPPPALPRYSGVVFHEERLECPAVQAGGLAVHVARVILPEVVTTAATIIPGEHFTAR